VEIFQNLERKGLIWKIFRNKDLADSLLNSIKIQSFGGGLTPAHRFKYSYQRVTDQFGLEQIRGPS
jgi:hypothetical protein